MRVALVTGANRGLGKAFAELLAERGFAVYAGMRKLDTNVFDNELITPIHIDVQDDHTIKAVIEKITTQHKRLDLLINNAGTNTGIAGSGKEQVGVLKHLDRSALRTMFDVNAIGPLMLVKAAVPLMSEPGSFIINISSDRASFQNENTIGNYGYRGSKVTLNMFTQCLLLDLPKNVSTFAVHPGWVKTDMNPNGVLTPHESASKILAILDTWKPAMNGAYLDNDGGHFPI